MVDAKIDQLAKLGDAFVVENLEVRFLERRRHLVLDDLDARLVADHLVTLLDRAGAADVEAHGGVELQRIAASRGFRRAVHDADLRSEEHTSELQSLMRISYAVFCL